jgi:hypothetical protein
MFDILGQSIVNELIIKQHLNLEELLKLRMGSKILYNFTDIKDKDNNEFLWKFYYLKNQMHNYIILPNSKNIHIAKSKYYSRNLFYEWYRKIYYPCRSKNKNDNISIDEVFNKHFNHKDIYLKELFTDCYTKVIEPNLHWNSLFEFWKDLGSPSIHLHHYDLSTCCFECNKKPINYKCFFNEIAKRTKTKYNKFLSLKQNKKELCEHISSDIKQRIIDLQNELEQNEQKILKIQNIQSNKEHLEEYLKTTIKRKKNKS